MRSVDETREIGDREEPIIDETSPVPKYYQLEDLLRQEIKTNDLRIGDRLTTEAELARRYGLSRPTVRQAIARLVSDGILYRRRGLGTFVAAPRLNYSIGIGLYDINYLSRPFFSQLAVGIGKVANIQGYHFQILSTNLSEESPQLYTHAVRRRNIDGLIIFDQRLEDEAVLEVWRAGLPVVLVRRRPPDAKIPSVQLDEAGGTFAAVEHLIGLGHKRIMLVAGTFRFPNDRLKLEAYREALAKHGLDYDPSLVLEHWGSDRREIERRLAGPGRPSAVAANDDMITLDVIRAAKALGLRIPEDLALVSYGDYLLHSFGEPALTTVKVPIEEMGEAAADMLFKQIQGSGLQQNIAVLEPRLVVRDSCGACPQLTQAKG